MCLSAIIWANIKEVYYGCTKEDAGNIGFRDDIIYDYLKGNNKHLICLKQLDREGARSLLEKEKQLIGHPFMFAEAERLYAKAFSATKR